MEKQFPEYSDFEREVETLHRFATYYDKLLRPDHETDDEIREALIRLNILETFTAYPFLLAAYESYWQGQIERYNFIDSLYVLENYMVRRFLAGEQTAYLNKMFPTLDREVSRNQFSVSLRQALLTKNYPSDNRIRQTFATQPIYDKRRPQRLILILETINRYLSKGSGGHTVLDNGATIEHIMPQTIDLNWKEHLGDEWDVVYREYLHTIGNLTIVTQNWNSSLSNSSFDKKRTKLASHALLLNSTYFSGNIEVWNKNTIVERAAQLTEVVLKVWESFGDPPAILDVSGKKPVALVVMGEAKEVTSWRDVAFQMAEFVSALSTENSEFDTIAEGMPTYFSRDERQRSRQMSNGWWVYINLSSTSVVSFCDQLSSMAGLPDEDWEIKLE